MTTISYFQPVLSKEIWFYIESHFLGAKGVAERCGITIKAERLRKKLTALKLTQSIDIGVTALKKYEEGDGRVSTYALMQIVCALGYNGVSIQCLDN